MIGGRRNMIFHLYLMDGVMETETETSEPMQYTVIVRWQIAVV